MDDCSSMTFLGCAGVWFWERVHPHEMPPDLQGVQRCDTCTSDLYVYVSMYVCVHRKKQAKM